MMMMMMMIMTDPFTTNLVVKGPVAKGSVVKGAHPIIAIIVIIVIIIAIIVFGICIQFFLSFSWSGVIMMVVYEEVDSETDMVAD